MNLLQALINRQTAGVRSFDKVLSAPNASSRLFIQFVGIDGIGRTGSKRFGESIIPAIRAILILSRRLFNYFRRLLDSEPGEKKSRAPQPPSGTSPHSCVPTRVPRPGWRLPESKYPRCALWSGCTVRR